MKNNDNGARWRKCSATAVLLTSGALAACQSLTPVAIAPPLALETAEPVDTLTPVELPGVEYRERVAEPDLLARVRASFGLPPSADAAIVREREWYARNPAYLD